MEIFGIGASELIFILIIAIIFLGPKDLQKAGRTIGRWLNYLLKSDSWKALQRASQEIKRLPTHLMREANLDAEELRQIDRELRHTIDPRYPSSASRSGPGRKSSAAPRTVQPPPRPTDSNSEPPAAPTVDPRSANEQDE